MPRLRAAVVAFALAALPVRAGAHLGVEELRELVERDVAAQPESPEKLLELVAVHRVAGEWDAALAALEHAAQHGADADVVEATRGQIYLEAGWPRMAIASFDRVLERRPDNAATRFGRARALGKLQRWDEAAVDYAAAFAAARQPRPEEAFEWRDALLAGGHPDLALAALDSAIARLGAAPSLQLAAIDLARSLGRDDDALRRIDGLLAGQPRNEAWLAQRGDILAALHRDAESRAAFAAALELIEARPAPRRGPRTRALQRQLEAALDAEKRAPVGPSGAPDDGAMGEP